MKRLYDDSLLILYNPKTSKPGYQRLPMSLLQLGALLEKRFSYVIIDGNVDQAEDPVDSIIEVVRKHRAAYLGVTIMPGPQLQKAVPHIRRIRQACPGLTTIIGGYFPTIFSESCVNDPDIDFVVAGPGETTLLELLETLEGNGDPERVKGLVFKKNGRVVRTPARGPVNPRKLPPIPYHRVDVRAYIAKTFLGSRTLSHHSSFGCPYQCGFCGVAAFSKGVWMAESASQVLDTVENLVDRWGMNGLEFHDSNFFVREKRVADFCEGLIDRNIRINWWGQGRIDTLLDYSEDTWDLLRKTGLKMVYVGAESGDDNILARMNKSLTADKTLKFAEITKKFQIVPEFSFICGNPPDPRADILKTMEFIRRIKRINPMSEIVLSRYDPVPMNCEMYRPIEAMGFTFPRTLDQWLDPEWEKIHRRRKASVPWLSEKDYVLVRNFQTVLNAHFPTTTNDWLYRWTNPWRILLFLFSSWRYRSKFYKWPYELELLQNLIKYRRPEVSEFGK